MAPVMHRMVAASCRQKRVAAARPETIHLVLLAALDTKPVGISWTRSSCTIPVKKLTLEQCCMGRLICSADARGETQGQRQKTAHFESRRGCKVVRGFVQSVYIARTCAKVPRASCFAGAPPRGQSRTCAAPRRLPRHARPTACPPPGNTVLQACQLAGDHRWRLHLRYGAICLRWCEPGYGGNGGAVGLSITLSVRSHSAAYGRGFLCAPHTADADVRRRWRALFHN
eukprot:4017949-Pleurochrysis_carterae.AAC.2